MLLKVPDESMNTIVKDRISKTYWTGGYKDRGIWKWDSDDSKVSYTNWNWMDGEPNNHEGNEDRITIMADGKWNDLSGEEVRRFICSRKSSPEKEVLCGVSSWSKAYGCHNSGEAERCKGECFWLKKSQLCVPLSSKHSQFKID